MPECSHCGATQKVLGLYCSECGNKLEPVQTIGTFLTEVQQTEAVVAPLQTENVQELPNVKPVPERNVQISSIPLIHPTTLVYIVASLALTFFTCVMLWS